MAKRRVTKTRKDRDGDILGLCADGQPWSPRAKAAAISDIELGLHTYYVAEAGFKPTVRVYSRLGVKHLKTDADATSKNNLDNLPNC